MDPTKNPYSPGAGSPPPELVGRDGLLTQALVLLARIKAKRSEKSILMTGLRGVGKTVLLNRFEIIAKEQGYLTANMEAHGEKSLGVLLIPSLHEILHSLDRITGAKDKIKRAFRVFRSYIGSLKLKVNDIALELNVEPEKGVADTGDIEIDLPNLLIAIGEAAEAKEKGVALLIDEVQFLESKELSALIMAMHKMQQKQLPIVLMGAGLPMLPELAGDSKSYADRLFSFPDLGPLGLEDVTKALQEPAKAAKVSFTKDAIEKIFQATKGYAYFVQEWGYTAWNEANENPISKKTIEPANSKVIANLDQNFFRVRFGRLTNSEKSLLYGMAQLGEGPHRMGDVAKKMKVKVTSLGPRRKSLIEKGMIYSPVHGDIAFTVPLFNEFILRAMPNG